MAQARIRPLHQRSPLLRSPNRNRRRRRLRSHHARAKLLLRRGRRNPHAAAQAHPQANPERTTLASRPRSPPHSPRHPQPHPQRVQATRNPLRRPTQQRRLPMHRHQAPNHRRRNPRNPPPNKPKSLQGHGKRLPKGTRRLLDPRSKLAPRYSLPRRERPRRSLRIRSQANPERRNRLRIHRRRNAKPPEMDRSMESGPNPLRIRRRHRRRSERQSPRQTQSKGPAMPTQWRPRLERNHPKATVSTKSFA